MGSGGPAHHQHRVESASCRAIRHDIHLRRSGIRRRWRSRLQATRRRSDEAPGWAKAREIITSYGQFQDRHVIDDHAHLEREVLAVVRQCSATESYGPPGLSPGRTGREYPDTEVVVEHSTSTDPTRQTSRFAIWSPEFTPRGRPRVDRRADHDLGAGRVKSETPGGACARPGRRRRTTSM